MTLRKPVDATTRNFTRPRGPQAVFRLGEAAIRYGAPEKLAGFPFVIENDQPFRELNEYLLVRLLGRWRGRGHAGGVVEDAQAVRKAKLALTSLGNAAHHVAAFSRWCTARHESWKQADEDVLEDYAQDCEADGVRPQSVNAYLMSITDFLFYAGFKGHRDAFHLTMEPKRTGKKHKEVAILFRAVDPSDMGTWHTKAEISRFIEQFDMAPAKMGAKVMYGLGLRISETVALDCSDFPTPEEWRADRGKRYVAIAGKGGKLRKVPLSLDLCLAVQGYIGRDRRIYGGMHAMRSSALILAPRLSGGHGRMTVRYLQKSFAVARKAAKMSSLHPHALRHHYAAHYLLDAWENRSLRGIVLPGELDLPVAESLLAPELIILKEAMGHVWFSTTIGYLKGLLPLMQGQMEEQYAAFLEGEQE